MVYKNDCVIENVVLGWLYYCKSTNFSVPLILENLANGLFLLIFDAANKMENKRRKAEDAVT